MKCFAPAKLTKMDCYDHFQSVGGNFKNPIHSASLTTMDRLYMTISCSFQFAVFSNVQCKFAGFYCKLRDLYVDFTFPLNPENVY